jgi:hypothetical protein
LFDNLVLAAVTYGIGRVQAAVLDQAGQSFSLLLHA